MNFDDFKLAVEALSGSKRTVLFDDLGYPSVMNVFPMLFLSELGFTGNTPHPAWIVNNNQIPEFYLSTFLNIIENNRAYSLPGFDPQCYKNHDDFKQVCQNKGSGWHMESNAEWSAVALWCKKNGTIPRGNNYCGCDVSAHHEKGVRSYEWIQTSNWNNMAYKQEGNNYYHTGRTLTGSGPDSWNHDHTASGVTDMNGNCWDRPTGMRLMDGEIQIIPNNDSAMGVDESRNSALWKAIMPDGRLVAPGTAGTLKYDGKSPGDNQQTSHGVGGGVRLNTVVQYPQYTGGSTEAYYGESSQSFQTMAAVSGVNVPDILKQLCLYPLDTDCNDDWFWFRNYGERVPLRGGGFYAASPAGLFALRLINPRSFASDGIGFRSAFVNL